MEYPAGKKWSAMKKGAEGSHIQTMTQGEMQRTLRAFSHDMRTPLSSVIALAQLSLGKLGAEQGGEAAVGECLRKILVAARDMEMMADELIAGEGARMESFTAEELSQSVSAAIEGRAEQKEQLLHIDVSSLGERALTGDRATLRRTLINLMSNAVKYTPEGGRVSLTARIVHRKRAGLEAEFVVEDNGVGMDEPFMAQMYEPLARSRQALEGGVPGHGLGLTIVKRLVERMNGTILVKSAPGQGTRFTLRVPLQSAVPETGAALNGMRFLLAEDNDLCAEIAQEILGGGGASVRRAADGAQAVHLFESLPAGTFDAILLDMQMPQMGGCVAAETIRALARADAVRIPILALTAGGDAQDEREAIAAGMNACLKKPLDIVMLRDAMIRAGE